MSTDEAAIRELDEQWGEAVARRDLDWLVDLYAPDGGLLWQGEPPVFGTANMRASWTTMLGTPGLSLRFTPERIDVAGHLASDYGVVTMGMTGPDGPTTLTAKYLVVWTKAGGHWRVLYDSYNQNSGG